MVIPVVIKVPLSVDPKTHPFILIQRFDVNSPKGKVELLEEDQPDAADENGSLIRQLQNQPVENSEHNWFFNVRTIPGPRISIRVFASFVESRLQAKIPRQSLQIGQSKFLSVSPAQMNQAPSVDQVLKVGPMPRLSVGINDANPPPLPQNRFSGTASRAMSHDPTTISEIVASVFERVKQPLDAIWSSQSPSAPALPKTPKFLPPDPIAVAKANEFWARQVTEMLSFTPYGGPTVAYATGKNPDFLFSNLKPGPGDKFYGLAYACENLATFIAASRGTAAFTDRGLEAGSVSSGITAKAGGKWFVAVAATDVPKGPPVLVELQNPDGKASSIPRFGSVVDVTRFGEQQADDAYFGPGTALLFCNRVPKAPNPSAYDAIVGDTTSNVINAPLSCRVEGDIEMCAKRTNGKLEITGPFPVTKPFTPKPAKPGTVPQPIPPDPVALLADHTASCHIGGVIRISPDRKQIQVFDTGGLGVPGRGNDVITIMGTGSGFHKGNMDDQLSNIVQNGGGEPFRGAGLFSRIKETDLPQFESQIQALMDARPLGFVRFALIDAGKQLDYKNVVKPSVGWLKFLSPLRPMYGAKVSENFSISRYLWSLREIPGFDDSPALEGWWFIYVPRGRLAKAMMADSSRKLTPTELATNAVATGPRNKEWNNKDGSLNIPRILRDMTLPILNAKSTAQGLIRITNNNFNDYGKMSRIHYAEGNWAGAQLPMDQFFMFTTGVNASIFPPDLVPPGTQQMAII